MENKNWINHWLCAPDFEDMKIRDMLHKQLDSSFELEPHEERLKNYHTLFRKKIDVNNSKQYILDITADDYYKLYINGEYVTQGPANSYPFAYYYNHLDITPFLHEGENILAVHVYYQGLINRAYNSGDYRQGLRAEVLVDGTVITDDNWRCTKAQEYGWSCTIAYDTQFDEQIDQNRKISGWKMLGFDDSDWDTAVVRPADDHILILQPTPNLQMEYVKPISVKQVDQGYLLDFGHDVTATFTMKAVGKKGDKITIQYGEELETETKVRNHLRCNCDYEDTWVLADGENYLEQFEYKCFRYVQLIAESSVQLSDFMCEYRHYPFDDTYLKETWQEPLLEKIVKICKMAVKNCSQEAFLDCPHREKGQYLGDLTVTAHALYYLTGDTRLFKKALQDFAHSTRICKGMMAVAPGSFMQEIADFSLLYPYQLLLYYRLSGDKELLRELLPIAEGVEEYFLQFQNQDGLLENVKTKWNLVDWPENLRDGYDFELPQPVVGDGCHNVINALYLGMRQSIEKIKTILEIPSQIDLSGLKEAYIHTFFREDQGLFADSSVSNHCALHSNIYAAFYGLQPEKNKIVELVRKKGLSCGVFTAYFVLYGMLHMGEKELVYELLMNKSEHSWYQMLKEGATSTFEAWGKDQKWNTSLCHAWAAAPVPVLMEYFVKK